MCGPVCVCPHPHAYMPHTYIEHSSSFNSAKKRHSLVDPPEDVNEVEDDEEGDDDDDDDDDDDVSLPEEEGALLPNTDLG